MTADLWPWLAVAGAGALHGANPCSGWLFVAARGAGARDARLSLHAIAPLAIGHVASIATVAGAFAFGLASSMRPLAGASSVLLLLLALPACARAARRAMGRSSMSMSMSMSTSMPMRAATPAGSARLALWSFLATTAQGVGMMLVPALLPVCLADSPARALTASGSIAMALAAVGVHALAMLASIAVVGIGAGRCLERARRGRALRAASRCCYRSDGMRAPTSGPSRPCVQPGPACSPRSWHAAT